MTEVTRGHKDVENDDDPKNRRKFVRAVLADLRALERMLSEGRFEKGKKRIGAEQEMFLVDRSYQPASAVLQMLDVMQDPHFTTELGSFQLEMNADPQDFSGDGFRLLERQLTDLLEKARLAARGMGLDVVLAGILPTIRKLDLGLGNMVPSPRYLALARATHAMRGSDFEFSIKGVDELHMSHDSVMVEACNSSFQVHLQVDADEFAQHYNLAQVLAGPILSSATNSPLLFGKRLWAETRIALFEQAVDTRRRSLHGRAASPRVGFGTRFLDNSIIEIFREDILRFAALVSADLDDEDPSATLDKDVTPNLKALRLHNGTVYRWNRACYGIIDGQAHLRVENRVLPSGPTILDEVANAALWCGLMVGLNKLYPDVKQHIDFADAQANFYISAREGLTAHFKWLDGKEVLASQLLTDTLLPIAESGLQAQGVQQQDIDRYLKVIDERVRSGRTGSRWALSSLQSMKKKGTPRERHNALVAATIARQSGEHPVSQWDNARLEEGSGASTDNTRVDQYMTAEPYTVQPEDAVELVVKLMDWEKISHVPVEDREHRLLGLLSHDSVIRHLAATGASDAAAADVMKTDVITVSPDTPTSVAVKLMKKHAISCLPVLQEGRLVGIVTETDFLQIPADVVTQMLRTE